MYWYIKYPMLIIVVLAALGLTGLIWRSCLRNLPQPENIAAETAVATPPVTVTPAIKKPVPAPPPAATFSRVEELLQAAEQQLQLDKLEAARLLGHNALRDPAIIMFDRYWFRAADIINTVNRRLMNSGAPCQEKARYTVQPGDNLSKLALRFYTSVEALKRLNALTGEAPVLHPRQIITYLPGAWSIRVSKQHFVLILYRDNVLYRYYRVGIGRENRTPVGLFAISSRIKHPAWTPPGKNIPYGHPDNILGTHWLGLVPIGPTDMTLSGYGIHGTQEPDSIGTGASAGCIRMRNEEVEELFDFIPEPGGTAAPIQVIIQE